VSDIDEASALLNSLVNDHAAEDLVTVGQIASASALHLGGDEQPTISGVYDSILQNWVASLPKDVPVRVRQHKERLARRVAAEVMLASTRVTQRDSQLRTATGQPSLSHDSGIAMPILSSQLLASQMSSQPLPAPLPSQSQSQSQSHSQPLPSAPPSALADPLARLRKHLKFRDDEATGPQPALAPSVTQLLSHWQPGANPSTYNWDTIERADCADNLDEASQRQLEKARKKKERLERKQQRENELAKSQPSSQPFSVPLPSSQPFPFTMPTAFPKSSPGPMLGSSQMPFTQVPLPGTGTQSQGLPGAQSQVVPGRFGGRVERKKKKKNRVSGF
jgi:RNA polymerase I-specific transcription initiation factor RRN6